MKAKEKESGISLRIFTKLRDTANDSKLPLKYSEECLLGTAFRMWEEELNKALKHQAEEFEEKIEKVKTKVIMMCQMCGNISHLDECCGNVSTTPIIALEHFNEILNKKTEGEK